MTVKEMFKYTFKQKAFKGVIAAVALFVLSPLLFRLQDNSYWELTGMWMGLMLWFIYTILIILNRNTE